MDSYVGKLAVMCIVGFAMAFISRKVWIGFVIAGFVGYFSQLWGAPAGTTFSEFIDRALLCILTDLWLWPATFSLLLLAFFAACAGEFLSRKVMKHQVS